jgi:hypothetical protein
MTLTARRAVWKCQSARSSQLPHKVLHAGSSSGVISHSFPLSSLHHEHLIFSLLLSFIIDLTTSRLNIYRRAQSSRTHDDHVSALINLLGRTSMRLYLVEGLDGALSLSTTSPLITYTNSTINTHFLSSQFPSTYRSCCTTYRMRHHFGRHRLLGMHWGLTRWRPGHPTANVLRRTCLPITSLCISRWPCVL